MNDGTRHGDDQTLSAKLKDLRASNWTGRSVQQQELAKALGISKSMVSGWENPESGKPPPGPEWLYKIATFFSRRVLAQPLSGSASSLDPDEAAKRDQLLAELRALAYGSRKGKPRNILQFPTDDRVRIISGEIPSEFLSELALPQSVNHIELMSHADLDAVVEMFGHVRALNPDSDVQIRKSSELEKDDPNSHLIVIGNLSRDDWSDSALAVNTYIAQPKDESDPHGEPFEYVDDHGAHKRHGATLLHGRRENPVVEDVGFIARRPNPINSRYTLTIFSGVLTRGAYGAVRSLTDRDVMTPNHQYLAPRFAASDSFELLIRVTVFEKLVVTPDFRDPNSIVFEYIWTDAKDGGS